MSMEKIEANVAFAIEKLGPLSDVRFGLNEESVVWVEGFIDGAEAVGRSRPTPAPGP
ncbi:hypothetical protein ACFY05_01755 [Microtetraspora fusca]|uniref:Uncharacterized protein n=1 Tax=Microtetraspora fusca TaxID=1997 RepID=A0ABW6UWZ1_MICFU